jgi:hypothetical protein
MRSLHMLRGTQFLAGLLCASLASPVDAAVFVVDSAEDAGPGSLREAIGLANASPGPHVIRIEVPGTGVSLPLSAPLPAIAVEELVLDASSSPGFLIDGQDLHRPLETTAGNRRLELIGIELRRGRAIDGGCLRIANRIDAELRLDTTAFRSCRAERADGPALGGAVHMPAGASLEIIQSSFIDNRANGTGSGQRGGALAVGAATLDLRESVFQNNLVSGGTANAARAGGAISLSGTGVSILFARGNRFINNATAAGSEAFGGAVEVNCAGCTVSIEAGYFGQNASGLGGALALRQGFSGLGLAVSLSNLSFERNTADSGGALYLAQTALDARNLSLQNNRAGSGAHLRTGPGFSLDRLTNSVFGTVDAAGAGSSCQLAEALSPSGPRGGNLFAELASCGGLSSAGSGLLAAGVQATLDATGGQMPVLVFPAGSGIIDRGGRQFACTLTDARESERPIDGDGDGIDECDIGAFEHPASPLLFRNGFETLP